MDKDSLSKATSGANHLGEIKPLNIAALSTLGEPDPTNITKQDIL